MPSYAAFSTAQIVLNRAAVQLGLAVGPASALPDPFASTDANMSQLIEMLTTLGDDLNSEHDWPQLRVNYTFTTVLGQSAYTLPTDFHEMINQSGWNRSARLPLIGPLSPQEWEYLAARSLGMFISVVFRLGTGEMVINPGVTVAAGIVIAYEYISTYWVKSSGGSAPDKSTPTVATDILLYDDELLISGVKLKWLAEHGFDTAAVQAHYDQKLEHAIGKSTGAPTLNMVGPATAVDRFIDNANLPLTGYGT